MQGLHTECTRPPTIVSAPSWPAFSRCTRCSPRRKENTRNLVVCIDGTSDQFGQDTTNVVKLFAKIDVETSYPEQYAYYSSGIGVRPKTLSIFNRIERALGDKFDMAIAWNIEEIVKDAYSWLARMYQEGDQIYLFGFSRGAYQVRVLAGMIHEVGLIRTLTDKQIRTAYDNYESIRSHIPRTREIAREFKNTFSWKDLKVHFIGVWDCVSSVGLVRGDVFLSTSSSAAHACHFRHALALDEFRVKFMPDYFHEMNSRTDDRKSKYIVTTTDIASHMNEQRESNVSDNVANRSGENENRTTDIKEVWFPGYHSDVGGKKRLGKPYQAGNVSLLWMRREAAACGLVLQPTDIVWVPDDLNLGTCDSMSLIWRLIEYMPIRHQVSFSGSGEDIRRPHRGQPRRIIPGQKVHASILYANAYKPQATLGEGFDISILRDRVGTKPEDDFWENGLFDDTAAQELLTYLADQQGVAPIYIDRLLFMLRFKEGKQCVRNVPQWQHRFKALITNREVAPLVRLVIIVAYHEAASCDPGEPETWSTSICLSQDIFDDAKETLSSILSAHKHRDGPRVIALLRPLTDHKILQERLLTPDVLEALVNLLDHIIGRNGGSIEQVINGLNCLLNCEDTREPIINKLGANLPGSDISRLSQILEVTDPRSLAAVLRMVRTLARIQEGRCVCSNVKAKLRQLAKETDREVGLLAVEISLLLYDPNESGQLDIRDSRVRANLASALTHSNPDGIDSGQQILRRLFGLDAAVLSAPHKRLIEELQGAVQTGNSRERTAATLTLLKLNETDTNRTYLIENGLLDVFINQLRRKNTALLAAYALTTCLKYSDMELYMMNRGDLANNIVNMLRLDYFDDAVGPVEGFQIFGDLMQHNELREKITEYNIAEVLTMKLAKGNSKETRTSLICLDIFRSFDPDGPWTRELVYRSLVSLREPEWGTQKVGVTILSALAQTEHGVVAISPRIYEIIEMLLPEGYLPIQLNTRGADSTSLASPSQGPPLPAATRTTGTLSWMMGPACALRILARNKHLRDLIRGTVQYGSLKHLYLTETLLNMKDTSVWRVRTPDRADITNMLDKMIKVVDEELSEEGLVSTEDAVLPHIQHSDRLIRLLGSSSMAMVTILPALLGISAVAILTIVSAVPIYLTAGYRLFQRTSSRYRDRQIMERLRGVGIRAAPSEHAREIGAGVRGNETGPSEHASGGAPSVHVGLLQRIGSRFRGSRRQDEKRPRGVGTSSPSDHKQEVRSNVHAEAGPSGHGGEGSQSDDSVGAQGER